MSYRDVTAVLWLILVAYWILSAWGNKPTVYRFNPVWRALSAIAIVGLFVLFEAYPAFFHRHVYQPTDACRAAGIAVCSAGVAFAIWARHTLGRNWSGNPTIKEGHELVERGPYRLVRHPIYTGIYMSYVALALQSFTPMNALIFAAGIALFVIKSFVEEGFLSHDPQYVAYMARVRWRWLPYVA